MTSKSTTHFNMSCPVFLHNPAAFNVSHTILNRVAQVYEKDLRANVPKLPSSCSNVRPRKLYMWALGMGGMGHCVGVFSIAVKGKVQWFVAKISAGEGHADEALAIALHTQLFLLYNSRADVAKAFAQMMKQIC